MTNKKNKKDIATPDPALSPAATPEKTLTAAANIKFCGRPGYDRGKRKILVANDPVESYSDGGKITTLPPADWQKRNRLFYHKAAAEIAATFPGLYKLIRSKRG